MEIWHQATDDLPGCLTSVHRSAFVIFIIRHKRKDASFQFTRNQQKEYSPFDINIVNVHISNNIECSIPKVGKSMLE